MSSVITYSPGIKEVSLAICNMSISQAHRTCVVRHIEKTQAPVRHVAKLRLSLDREGCIKAKRDVQDWSTTFGSRVWVPPPSSPNFPEAILKSNCHNALAIITHPFLR